MNSPGPWRTPQPASSYRAVSLNVAPGHSLAYGSSAPHHSWLPCPMAPRPSAQAALMLFMSLICIPVTSASPTPAWAEESGSPERFEEPALQKDEGQASWVGLTLCSRESWSGLKALTPSERRGVLGKVCGGMSAQMNELKQYKSRALLLSTPDLILFR